MLRFFVIFVINIRSLLSSDILLLNIDFQGFVISKDALDNGFNTDDGLPDTCGPQQGKGNFCKLLFCKTYICTMILICTVTIQERQELWGGGEVLGIIIL